MFDKVPIDPQQAIKRESPFTDETGLILSLFEVRLNILVTIFCARVTKVVCSLWYCLYLVPKENKCLHCCFVKDMTRKMWSCQLCAHNQCAVLCALTVGYISVAIANVFCRLMPILMLFKSLFRGGKLQIPSLWNDTFLQEQHITICRRMLLEIARTDDYYKMLQPLMITKCVTRFGHKFLRCVLQNAFILAKCRNCYYKMLVSPSITFVVALKSLKLVWAVKITF